MWERRGVYTVLVGKREGKRQLGRYSHRLEDILKRIFRMWDGEAWTELIWRRIRTSGGLL